MKTSLEKSHSKLSNFKLTLICILAVVLVSILWIGVSILNKHFQVGLIALIIGVLGTIGSLVLFNIFKR